MSYVFLCCSEAGAIACEVSSKVSTYDVRIMLLLNG